MRNCPCDFLTLVIAIKTVCNTLYLAPVGSRPFRQYQWPARHSLTPAEYSSFYSRYSQPPANISIQSDSQLDGVLLNLQVNLTDFLKTIEHILYNPTENELVMHNRNSEVGLVYHFNNRQFYLSTKNFDSVVQNTFPNLFVIEDKKIRDYLEAGSP